jgi:type III secretory pathway lipoprotein EscJ
MWPAAMRSIERPQAAEVLALLTEEPVRAQKEQRRKTDGRDAEAMPEQRSGLTVVKNNLLAAGMVPM